MSVLDFNKVSGIFGKRGSGKTDYMIGNAQHNIPGVFKSYLKRGIKVIVIDTFDHPSYRQFPIIPMNRFADFKQGVGRILVKSQDIPALNLFLNSHPNTWNSLLVYEDARKHTYKTVDKSLMELIGDSKQKNIDICFMYHCFAHAPKDLYRYLDYIELFKTKDSPMRRREELEDCLDEAMTAYEKVKNHPNKFYHTLIDTERE